MSHSTVDTEVPFDLAEIKLAAPLIRPGTVAKADVIARLCASRLPFATVVAPAGYGKTTLLARWAEADPRPFAWVALDGRDDDALMFLRYIAAAVNRVEPLPLAVLDALSGPGGSTWSTWVPRLGSGLAGLERPLVLVLDDVHAVPGPACLDVLAALVDYVPGRFADRGRESRVAVAAGRPLARPGPGPGDRRRRTYGWTSGRPRCCWRRRESSSTRPGCPN